jgi:hypothetical protein
MLALLLAQWALASYVCPVDTVASATAAAMTDMPGCSGMVPAAAMDPDQPQLCRLHCDAGLQPVNSGGTPDAPPAMSMGPALIAVLDTAAIAAMAAASPPSLAAGPPRGAPPIYLALRVLRN